MRAGLGALVGVALAARAAGEEPPPPGPPPVAVKSLQDLAKDHHNPFGDTIKLPFTLTGGVIEGPDDDVAMVLDFEPIVPISLHPDWDLIVRPCVPLTYVSGPDDLFGLGDMQLSFFATPSEDTKWIWGVGPIFQFPTATREALGSEKWCAGPTAALVYSNGPWFNAVLAYHLWSFAGDPDRERVNQTYLEPLISYNFASGWFIQCDPAITYDWTADASNAWSIPIGLDTGRPFQIAGHSIGLQIGAYWFVEHPEDTPEWIARVQVTFQFSS